MSLLQSPAQGLDQIDWYLANKSLEIFPGAFYLAAGNLCRQVLEQLLFVLAFYSGMPPTQFMKTNGELRTAGSVLKMLLEPAPLSSRTYLELARRRGARIRKFARYPRSLNRWRRLFNEPSHFRNPAANPRVKEREIASFSKRIRSILDDQDHYLITAAVNELKSRGRVKAVLGPDPENTPGVEIESVVTVSDIAFKGGRFSLKTPKIPIRVVPDSQEVPLRWSRTVILVQHSSGMSLRCRLVTRDGSPVDCSSLASMIRSLVTTTDDLEGLRRRLRRFGVTMALPERSS